MVLEVAGSFGFVRETNYGRLFDVRVENKGPAPGNLAFTSRAIRPHTDNPYRDPVPTVQLLHCLRAAVKGDGEVGGGDTGLVDGFAAAAAFRASDPESFGIVAETPVPFGYVDKETELRASLPLIQLSPRGRIRGVRFNNRSARPLRLPYAEVTAFYPAYRRWAELLAEPGRQLNLRLAPGDCLVFDNTRVRHARTAFRISADEPGRHLQGCYADLDGLASTLAVLKRSSGGLGPPGSGVSPGDRVSLRASTDARHGDAGVRWLSQWFGEAVTEPVRLHVAAKRYLCATEPGYFGHLSAESVRTLVLQGGPMAAEQAAAFEARPYARDAVAVRRWDDEAKDPSVTPPGFGHFAPLLTSLLRS